MIRRCLRLQLRSQLPASLAVLLVFGLGSFLGVALTGRAEGLFYIYYQMYPAMGLFVLFIYGSTNTANLANVVLSLGVTRREFCTATQWLGLIMALLAAALGIPVALLPGWTGLTWIQPPLSLGALPVALAVLVAALAVGWIWWRRQEKRRRVREARQRLQSSGRPSPSGWDRPVSRPESGHPVRTLPRR